jgi:hypothetical protein
MFSAAALRNPSRALAILSMAAMAAAPTGQQRIALQAPGADTLPPSTPWPSNAAVAILLRGQAFRGRPTEFGRSKELGCNRTDVVRELQLRQGREVVANLVEPLEQLGNRVDLIVTETSGGCDLDTELLAVYDANNSGRSRIVASDLTTISSTQGEGVRQILDLFEGCVRHGQCVRESAAPGNPYALIMVARHDITWERRITETSPPADPGKFNFLSKCELNAFIGLAEGDCHNDAFFMFPGQGFDAFDKALGEKNCFAPKFDNASDGHGCAIYVRRSLGENSTTTLTDWRPKHTVRDPGNPVAHLE